MLNTVRLNRGLAACLVFLSAAFLLPLFSQKIEYENRRIEAIEFAGLHNIKVDEIVPLLLQQAGDEYKADLANKDIKAIYGMGNFGSVAMRIKLNPDGSITIIFDVEEHPRVHDIKFLGTDELYSTDLKELLPFKEGEVYSPQKVKEGLQKIKDKYKEEGFFLAEVWSKVALADGEANQIDVTYLVDEGENIPIARINITGTRHLDTDDLMANMDQKEKSTFENGVFKESKFEEDKLKILAIAKTNGYLDAEIDPLGTGYEIRWRNPKDKEKGRVVVVTYKLIEGNIRYYGGYSLDHDEVSINRELNPPERKLKKPGDLKPIFTRDQLLDNMEYSSDNIGEVFDEGKYFRDRAFVQEMYSQQGYVFTQVQPHFVNFKLSESVLDRYAACLKLDNPKTDEEKLCKKEAAWLDLKTARRNLSKFPEMRGRTLRHVHFTVRENGLAYIENIIVKGMVKTQERVIRRELLMKEGQLFNSMLVNRSREKLINLGYFKEVNLEMRPGSDDQKMNLIIDVKEQPTGTISMGGGYGTQSGFAIFTEVGENNLSGTGQRISGRLEYGPLRRQVRMDWTDPWVYEACEDTTGSFWRNKQKDFDSAKDYESILKTADSLQNAYREIGIVIASYVKEAGSDRSIEMLDRVKAKVRTLIRGNVMAEEECFRSIPKPWALTLFASYQSARLSTPSITISDDSRDHFEGATYDKNTLTVGGGTAHTFILNWVHYHRYTPSWSTVSKPTSLVTDRLFRAEAQGWQFMSALTNGLSRDTRDNIFNTTQGLYTDLSMEIVGQALGGQDHFNMYSFSTQAYWWWFDYSLGGLFRRSLLRRWRVVQEVRFTAIMMNETAPWHKSQNKDINPYIEPEQRLYLGGYESLRGYNYYDSQYPFLWQQGGNHMILFSTETRFPIEPSILWLTFFFDAGALYRNIGEFNGDLKTWSDTYRDAQDQKQAASDPFGYYISDKFSPVNLKRYPFDSRRDWDDPRRAVLSERNVALDRALYSWGVGLRINIPVLPLRLFFAQKGYYSGSGKFSPIPGEDKFQFVFGIGDYRY
ncbi:MAG: BamA/TamA family outer membrane protein [Spirochaetia bacterium]|nr:BamA/TamA family outer membrane protein [Spirochaetia bacterium]